ncbi:MAG: hypothetical protein QXM62_05420 [Ignisphaera sp.]
MYRQSQATSIGFDNPYMLLFAPISIAILFLLYMRSRKRVYELSAKLGKAGDARVAKLVAIAKFAVPILLSLAAAQPYTVTVSHMAITMDNVLDVNTANIRIIVMLDTSKSMGYGDVPPSREAWCSSWMQN